MAPGGLTFLGNCRAALNVYLSLIHISPGASVEIWATHSNLSAPPLLARRFLAAVRKILETAAPAMSGA